MTTPQQRPFSLAWIPPGTAVRQPLTNTSNTPNTDWTPGCTAGYDFSDLNDDELLDRIREYESRRIGTAPGTADGAGAPQTGTDTDPVADRQE